MQTNFFTGTSGNTSTGAISAAMNATQETKDLFTTLLVAQIQNQNPLEPTDSKEFVNQLTQLSQTEALQTLTSQNASSLSMMESMQVLNLGSQVGSELMVRTDRVTLDGEAVKGSLTLNTASAQTTLVLTGSKGAQHRIDLGTLAVGDNDFTLQPSQWGLPADTYQIAVETSTGENPAVEIAGTLENVRLGASGSVLLTVAHLGQITANMVTRFNGRSAS